MSKLSRFININKEQAYVFDNEFSFQNSLTLNVLKQYLEVTWKVTIFYFSYQARVFRVSTFYENFPISIVYLKINLNFKFL